MTVKFLEFLNQIFYCFYFTESCQASGCKTASHHFITRIISKFIFWNTHFVLMLLKKKYALHQNCSFFVWGQNQTLSNCHFQHLCKLSNYAKCSLVQIAPKSYASKNVLQNRAVIWKSLTPSEIWLDKFCARDLAKKIMAC